MTPLSITLTDAQGEARTIPLRQGSWSGSGYRAVVEIDGKRHVIYVDTARS